jgi:outer membrane cobalamin receptor
MSKYNYFGNIFMKIIFVVILSFFLFGSAKAQHTVSGTITEQVSGEYVIGASVMLMKDSAITSESIITGSVTNKFGFYSIPGIKSGEYYIAVSSLGYEKYLKQIKIEDKDVSLNIGLSNEDIRMKEVLVEAENERAMTDKVSQIEVSPQFIQKMPAFGGEVDVFRTMMLLPGVQQASELSSGLYIRGGSPDQNLVLLDDVIVYNPTHLAGFLSSFNSDALRDVKLIKGAFPAEYGGRLSSVIDLTMKEGTKEKLSGAGAISLISSKLTLEGPINDNSSFMVSGRRMYLDLITALSTSSDEEMPEYYFYDLNAKVNYKISENDRIFASGYFARDVFGFDDDYEDFKIFWGNRTGNLRWMHIFNPKLFSNFSLIYTNYEFQTNLSDRGNTENNYNSLSQIADIMLRGNIEYFLNNEHTIKAGAEITNHNFEVRASLNFSEADFDFVNTGNLNTLDMAFYVQDEWKIGKFRNNFGARAYYFQEGDYFDIEPRLSSVYKYNDNLSFKASFDIAHQYVHLVTRNDINLPTDLWFPSTAELKPQKAMQGVIGIEKTFLNGEYLLSVEGYYKDMKNLIEFKDDATFNFGMPTTEQFTFGEGRAYGMEVFFNRRIGNLTGWVGYTLAWTDRKFPELNDGKRFSPRYDRRHDISIAATYNISDGWEIGAAWVFGTGQAFTVPDGSYYMSDPSDNEWTQQKYHYSDRNGFRLPPYHRLDLNLMRKFDWFGLPFEFSINIYNVYNRRNPFTWYIGEDWNPQTGDYEKNVTQVTLFPIIPTFGLRFEF